MAKLIWDKSANRLYETGVKNGVLYPMTSGTYVTGGVWNGLTAVTESPSGAEATPLYADDMKYLELYSKEEFGGTIEAYMYPDEFKKCIGEDEQYGVTIGQQSRSRFGFCYRTTYGDADGNQYYKLHLIYNAMASVAEKAYTTINDSPEAMTFSWEFTTTPADVLDSTNNNEKLAEPTSVLTIDSQKAGKAAMTALEEKLYGGDSDSATPTLPSPGDVIVLIKKNQTATTT